MNSKAFPHGSYASPLPHMLLHLLTLSPSLFRCPMFPYNGRLPPSNWCRETNTNVTSISLDFSKVLDSIRLSALAVKLANADIPDFIYNWIVQFLKDRGHTTRFAGGLSGLAYINASIVQRSGIGPTAYDISSSDLRSLNHGNYLFKFADDS